MCTGVGIGKLFETNLKNTKFITGYKVITRYSLCTEASQMSPHVNVAMNFVFIKVPKPIISDVRRLLGLGCM